MSRTNKKKGGKAKQFKGDSSFYWILINQEDGVKKTVKKIMKRKARRDNKIILKIEIEVLDELLECT